MFSYDPQKSGPQYLENLATGYWFSEVLFTAVEMEIFTLVEAKGLTAEEAATFLNVNVQGLERFLQALCAMGLLTCDNRCYHNTQISSSYLVKGEDNYQGDSILWRKYLSAGWQNLIKCLKAGGRVEYGSSEEDSQGLARRIRKYITAMDRVARTKVDELLPFFTGASLEGEILDVGAGSGAVAAGFMERFPAMRATLMDIPEVLDYTQELMQARGLGDKTAFCQANILEAWPVKREAFDVVILSNIVHAYAESEISDILAKGAETLKPGGIMVIHDFFLEHWPEKAALFDLNMFINTYNGKVFSEAWVRRQLAGLQLHMTELIPLKTDTAVILASKTENSLSGLCLDEKTRLAAKIRSLGFREVYPVATENIHIPDWADMKCQYGCSGYGKRHCPPISQTPDKTRELLKDYRYGFIIEGEPPTGAFQHQVLEAEKEAFKSGFHKAFAYWAGPCSICSSCAGDGVCRNPAMTRPSMEGAGIDVFVTVRRAGIALTTLRDRDEYVKYFALLLLE